MDLHICIIQKDCKFPRTTTISCYRFILTVETSAKLGCAKLESCDLGIASLHLQMKDFVMKSLFLADSN